MSNCPKDIGCFEMEPPKSGTLSFTPSAPRCVMDTGGDLIVLDVGTSRNWQDQCWIITTTYAPCRPSLTCAETAFTSTNLVLHILFEILTSVT